MFIWNLYDFLLIFVVLDIWALSVSCGVYGWFGLWWGVTTCMSVECYEGDFEVHIYSDVQATSRSTQDSWCLLDALWGASTCLRVWFDFMLFRSATMGARCCQTLTREGHAPVRIRPEYSYRGCRFMGVIWRNRWQVDALLRPSCTSRWDMSCARSVCARVHGLVLRHFSSIHDRDTTIRSAATSTCDAWCLVCGATYPSGPKATSSNTDTCPFWCGPT